MAVGAAVSVTVVAVALHGWQNTFFLYAALLFIFALLWLIIIREPQNTKSSTRVPFREALANSIKSRDVWFCVIAFFGINGLSVEFTGYLPTYLQNIGWSEATSSVALTIFFLGFVVGVPILLALSDKIRLRKIFIIIPAFICIIVIGLTGGNESSRATLDINSHRWDLPSASLMPMLRVILAETKGIGARYAGTANSISSGIGGGAGLLFAAVGGKLALSKCDFTLYFRPTFMPYLYYSILFYQGDRNQKFGSSPGPGNR